MACKAAAILSLVCAALLALSAPSAAQFLPNTQVPNQPVSPTAPPPPPDSPDCNSIILSAANACGGYLTSGSTNPITAVSCCASVLNANNNLCLCAFYSNSYYNITPATFASLSSRLCGIPNTQLQLAGNSQCPSPPPAPPVAPAPAPPMLEDPSEPSPPSEDPPTANGIPNVTPNTPSRATDGSAVPANASSRGAGFVSAFQSAAFILLAVAASAAFGGTV